MTVMLATGRPSPLKTQQIKGAIVNSLDRDSFAMSKLEPLAFLNLGCPGWHSEWLA